MQAFSIDALPTTPLGGEGLAHIRNVEEAAREFQALLISQLLKIARESGKLYESEDSMTGDEGYLELAEQQFARVLAEKDFLGLSRMMLDGISDLQRHKDPTSPKTGPRIRPPQSP